MTILGSVGESMRSALVDIANSYPDTMTELVAGTKRTSLRDVMLQDVDRVTFEIKTLSNYVKPKARVADIGGGLSLLTPSLARFGFECILVDDFGDRWHSELSSALEIHRKFGVNIIRADILEDEVGIGDFSLDAVMSFDMLEHLHNSPKKIFAKLMNALKSNGLFFIGAPNCVNLRKRLTVPFGVGNWSQIQEWYDEPVFRGHVREPDVGDFRYIAGDLGLKDVQIIGKNWLGYGSRYPWVRTLTPFVDTVLQLRPSLCSNLYLIGRKP
jgi:2-polyprenyl-3-methyl-5-hydroxy-6-metoxy-1,4-benzoquinol methylase